MKKTETLFQDLVVLIRTLRGDGGCPWDKKQTIETLQPFLQQEFHELMEALDKNSPENAQEEMGDLLFLLLFCAEISRDQGDFSIEDVLEKVKVKMIGRHPHVFEGRKVKDVSEIRENWNEIKTKEKLLASRQSLEDKIPRHLPALLQACWVSRKKSEGNNEGKNPKQVVEQMANQTAVLQDAIAAEDQVKAKHQLGDLFMCLARLSQLLKLNPEEALKESLSRSVQDL